MSLSIIAFIQYSWETGVQSNFFKKGVAMGKDNDSRGKLDGKVAIITGGASGIGKGICGEFSEQGASIVILDIDLAKGQEAAKEIESQGGRALTAKADVCDFDQVRDVADRAVREFGSIDILVNCAGWHKFASVEAYTIEEWQKIRSINLDGHWNCCQSVIPQMIRQKSGKIINIGSSAGIMAIPKAAPYSISKHAIIGLTKTFAVDLAVHQINVNCICPSTIDTPLLREATSQKFIDGMLDRIPLGRLGKYADIAKAALFLASEDSDWITGIVLPVDGGLTCCIRAHHYE
jgi:3-oxoacyl-[acyl-carrier protein] reductase